VVCEELRMELARKGGRERRECSLETARDWRDEGDRTTIHCNLRIDVALRRLVRPFLPSYLSSLFDDV
jgi:hypothetical protein